MSLSKWKAKVCVAVAVSAIALSSYAGGPMVGGASEWTQIMNNIELVQQSADGAQTAMATMQSYLTQLKQLQYAMENSARVDGSRTATDYLRILDEIRRARAAAEAYAKVKGSLDQQTEAMNLRVTEARVRGQSWDAYRDQVTKDAQDGNSYEAARLRREQEILDAAAQDAQDAAAKGQEIDGEVGHMQALQMTNRQLNQVVVQNAKMTEVLVGLRQTAGEQNQAAKEKEAASARTMDLATQRYEAIRARQRKAVGLQ